MTLLKDKSHLNIKLIHIKYIYLVLRHNFSHISPVSPDHLDLFYQRKSILNTLGGNKRSRKWLGKQTFPSLWLVNEMADGVNVIACLSWGLLSGCPLRSNHQVGLPRNKFPSGQIWGVMWSFMQSMWSTVLTFILYFWVGWSKTLHGCLGLPERSGILEGLSTVLGCLGELVPSFRLKGKDGDPELRKRVPRGRNAGRRDLFCVH